MIGLTPDVIDVSVVEQGVLRLTFADGLMAELDVLDRMRGPVFARARTLAGFAEVVVDDEGGTVAWPGGADLAPDTLYARAKTGAWPDQNVPDPTGMRPELQEIIRLACGPPDEPSQHSALTELALALEIKNQPGSYPEKATAWRNAQLSDSLRKRPLDDDDEQEVVASMLQLALAGECDAQRIGPIGVIGSASESVSIDPLLTLLIEQRERFGPEANRQVLLGLERALRVFALPPEEAENRSASHVSLVLSLRDPRRVVDELASHESARVTEVARRLRPRIDPALEYLRTRT